MSLSFVLLLGCFAQSQERPTDDLMFKDRVLGFIGAPSFLSEVVFSSDGTQFAYIHVGKGYYHSTSGKKAEKRGNQFDIVRRLTFSPDGKTLAYVGIQPRNQNFLAVGESITAMSHPITRLTFSPDGKTVAYSLAQGDRWRVVVGDKKSDEFDEVSHCIFSPDGKTYAYSATEGRKSFVMAGETKGPEFKATYTPAFSPDGKTLAYPARMENRRWAVVVGDKAKELDEGVTGIWSLVFSPDGRTIAYVAEEGRDRYVVVGDKKGPVFENAEEIVFSPDGKTLAYKALLEGSWILVIGDHRIGVGQELAHFSKPVFNQDGSKAAFGAVNLKTGQVLWKVVTLTQ